MCSKTVKSISLLLVTLSVVACGFKLRGAIELPSVLLPLYVDTRSDNQQLTEELHQLFENNQVELATSQHNAAAVLSITQVTKERRVLSVDSRGRVQEYELSYSVQYQLQGKGLSEKGIDTQVKKLELKRELLFDPTSVLAVNYETETLYRDMAGDGARLILQQLRASAKHVKTSEPL